MKQRKLKITKPAHLKGKRFFVADNDKPLPVAVTLKGRMTVAARRELVRC